tara:strand:- start:156 stop:806 length:651 start_codon:yes stop_codon:yes gene_type:complete
MMETKTIQKRQVAWKVPIKDLLEGEYVKEEGEWQPNYILFNQKKIARANVLGVVIGKEDNQFGSLMVDDGTGQIAVRSFEHNPGLVSAKPGSLVLVVGRPREYMQERYIVAEIIREMSNKGWFEIRKREISSELPLDPKPVENIQPNTPPKAKKPEQEADPEVVCALIKEKDAGEGADMQEIIDHLKRQDAEEIVKRMLAQGELFEVQPGKIKVLE